MRLIASAFATILLGALLTATSADADNVRKTCTTNGNTENNHAVPEPSTLILLGAGIASLLYPGLGRNRVCH